MKADVDQKAGASGSGATDRIVGGAPASGPSIVRSRLFIKYVALFVSVVVLALVANGAFEVWFSFQEQKSSLINIQHQQAEAAADKIEEFVTQIQSQLGWTTQLPWTNGTLDQRRFDALRLLRQVPAITELAQIDASGHEQLKVSRLTMDVVGSGIDYSGKPEFTEAMKDKVYYGPVYFRRESEPYMTIALAGARPENGVSIAQVNLKLIWDVISGIKVGEKGQAYVVDADGRLIAHPDISLVLRNTDMSKLTQVQAARAGGSGEDVQEADDITGHKVLTAYAPVHPLGWFVFVETPIEEAYAPLYRSIQRTGYVLFGALALAFIAGTFLARRMVVPIQALRAGTARIGAGDLAQRIDIKTGDEVESLADQFNDMAGRLQESYANLEKKVDDRTRELTDSLEQQTATSEVLRVISSSPGELEPVFQAMLANAVRICDSQFGTLFRHDDGTFEAVALFCTPPALTEFHQKRGRFRPAAGAGLERLARTKDVIRIADETAEPTPSVSARLAGARSVLVVPMLKEHELIGAISIYRGEVRPFTDKQVALVKNFAAQAVIAIENARLLNELRESLAQQTATSEVLSSIAGSRGELKPVFDIILASANRLCEANYGTMYLREGDRYRATARQGHLPATAEQKWWSGELFQPRPDVPFGRAVAGGRPVLVDDLANEPAYRDHDPWMIAGVDEAGIRSMCAVPMMKDAELVGVMAFYRRAVRPFTEKQIALVENFAAQAVIAIENARLLSELRESLEQQTATSDVLRVISSSPGDLEPVFHAMLENATRICEAKFGVLSLKEGDRLRVVAMHNPPPAYAELRRREPTWIPTGQMGRIAAQAAASKQAIQVPDLAAYGNDDPLIRDFATTTGARSLILVPLLKEGEVIGTSAIYRQEVRPFTDKQVELLTNFAAQAVIAIENARLLGELRQRTDDLTQSLNELRTAQDRLVQTEKLASLGQLTAGIAHEIKNPLNFVNNFSTLSVELIDELQEELAKVKIDAAARAGITELSNTLKGNLDKIAQHGKRADSIVKNMLLHSREGSGEHRPVDINALVEESLNLAYHGARAEKQGFNIALQRSFDPAAGDVDLYPQEVTRVLLNLISNGFYAATKRKTLAGGENFEPVLAAATKNLGDRVEIRIRDNGTGIPPEVKEKMFNPFFTTKPAGEGTGLGLSISHDIIVKQHSGTIAVDTEPGKFTEFTIVLPRRAAAFEKTGGRA
jgi:signal transduction histidine kinase